MPRKAAVLYNTIYKEENTMAFFDMLKNKAAQAAQVAGAKAVNNLRQSAKQASYNRLSDRQAKH